MRLNILGRLGGLLLSPYVAARLMCVGPFVRCFSGFSVCPLHDLRSTACPWTCFRLLLCRLLHLLGIQWPFPQFLWEPRIPSRMRLWSLYTNFCRCILCGEPRRPSFHRGLSPCFQCCLQRCFQLGYGCCQLAFLRCRCVEIAIICVYIHHRFYHPQLLLLESWPEAVALYWGSLMWLAPTTT